jgi:hypothetical protein
MDWAHLITYVANIVFWGLVLIQMMFATLIFCLGNQTYDATVKSEGATSANLVLWVFGFLATGMPILQAGQWLQGSVALAWGLLVIAGLIWMLIFKSAYPDL